MTRETNFDGLVGPTHNYGGLSPGNVASLKNEGRVSNPRAAALEGLSKMRFVHDLGVSQGVLPPASRPDLRTLRRLGFNGADEEVLAKVAREHDHLLRLCASASSMWAANAATVAPSADTADQRLHLVPANLTAMFHRAIEAEGTTAVLRAIFADESRFAVHHPLPGASHFADEGAANHTRLHCEGRAAVHLFAWGRSAWQPAPREPTRFPARQTQEASRALARLLHVDAARALFPQQHPAGIDAGAFHTDVLAVGQGSFLMMHELAFLEREQLMEELHRLLGPDLTVVTALESELPVADAVGAYPFNSQLVTLPSGKMAIVAPEDSRENARARAFLERVVSEANPVETVFYRDVRQSMDNGGGPACLRLRVPLSEAELGAISARVIFTPALHAALEAWVHKHYRDRLAASDLADGALWREVMAALDELTQILRLPSIYAFQR